MLVSNKLRIFLQATLLLSAFLLFCFQPMVAKMVLPLLGGAAAVWTTAVLFFQLMLLAGYLYADRLARLESLRVQMIVHLVMMTVAVLFLPVRLHPDGFGAATLQNPALVEFLGLLKTAGIPYFMVSTTAPLLQSWFSRADETAGRDPYFLYAASNAGSLLALIAYPFLIEPTFGVSEQSRYWLGAYLFLVLSVAVLAAVLWKTPAVATQRSEPSSRPALRTRMYWLLAAFVPSGLMLAITTHISVNLVPMPLVWTLPLGIYLLTFILAFGRRIRVTSRRVAQLSLPVLVLLCPVVGIRVPVVLSIDVVSHCHPSGLAVRGRPLVPYGTGRNAAGPAPSDGVLRLDRCWRSAGWGFCRDCCACSLHKHSRISPASRTHPLLSSGHRKNRWVVAGAMACLVLGYAFYLPTVLGEKGETVFATRNFFGVKRVIDTGGERKLLHGDTLHGMESRDPESAGEPMIYYHRDGPLGDVMEMMRTRSSQRVAVVGLGAGSIAAYAGPDRHITFYEIDPEVEEIAGRFFTFLPRCGNHCDVVLADGRLAIARAPQGTFDLIVLDAFSSDAIPSHLVSREALEVYLSRLKPDGVVLFSRLESLPEGEGPGERACHRGRPSVAGACRPGRRRNWKERFHLRHCLEIDRGAWRSFLKRYMERG